MRRALILGLLALQGCKTISENPVLIETVENMEPLRSLELPQKWTPIKNRDVWHELQFVYPVTNGRNWKFTLADCKGAFLNPKKEHIQFGRLGNSSFNFCIRRLIAQSGNDADIQEVFIRALLNWSTMDRDPWRQIPKRPYQKGDVPYWYESTANFSIVTTWYAINRNLWSMTDQQKTQIDHYLQNYFAWADYDTPTQSGFIACPIGNPAGTARQIVDTDTCGSTRMKATTATLALALATNHRVTYEKALQHMAVVFHQYDDEGFFVPYMAAQKQGKAFSYYFESARFLSSWIELFATAGIDLLAYRMPSGVTVEEALNTAYRVTKNHKLLGKYPPDKNYDYGEYLNSNWAYVGRLSQHEFERQEYLPGAWDFQNNVAQFTLHNPRFAVEKLGLDAVWETGYDGFLHTDFHAFQPVHLYLANRVAAQNWLDSGEDLRSLLARERAYLPSDYLPIDDQACHFDLARVDMNGRTMRLGSGKVSWVNGQATNWKVTWRQPREELKYHKEQNLNLFASATKELFGDFQLYYLAKSDRIGWAKFNEVSANTDIRLLNGRYLGSLSHIDRKKLNPEFKILYQLRLCKLGDTAKFDPFVENDGQLKADMACKDPKFAALMGQKCE